MNDAGRGGDSRLGVAFALTIGVLLRLYRLGTWPWEQDEFYTLRDARDLGLTAGGAPGIAGRPLYYLLQHLLLKVFPPEPLYLRLPAFTFGVLGIVATWWLARRAFGHRAGWIAATLMAVSPWHLYASQFARYWTLVCLLVTLTYDALIKAVDRDRRGPYLAALGLLLLGTMTHPTFLFPIVGVAPVLYLVSREGSIRLRWPTRLAWGFLWGPATVAILGVYVALSLTGHGNALQNLQGRGFVATIRLVPAMIQWTPLVAAGAGAVAIAFFIIKPPLPGDRRWGMVAAAGISAGILMLIASSLQTGVYADYGITLLPLVYVSVGGGIERIAAALPTTVRRWASGGSTTVLLIAIAPGTISHLSDGSRFDFQSAYETLNRLGPSQWVAGGIEAYRQAFAPRAKPLPRARRATEPLPKGFWFVASYQRYGIRGGKERLDQWLAWNCRRVAVFERPRYDYRVYRVTLHWCGSEPVPGSMGVR